MPDYKPVIAANEVLHLKADAYVSAIPAESIMSNESGHEKYLASLLSSLKQISNMSDVFPFYGEDGVYLSKVPIYYFDVIHNKVGNIVYFAVFTKDFSKAASVNFYLEPDFEGEGKRREICSDIQAIWEHEKLLIEKPDKLYIALLNAGITFLIDADNNIHNKSLGAADLKIEGDYYHALDYDRLAVSYAKIADRDNLIWIDFSYCSDVTIPRR